MAEKERPTLTVEIIGPRDLADLRKWADLADVIGFPSNSPVAVEVFKGLRVTAWLDTIDPATQGEAT